MLTLQQLVIGCHLGFSRRGSKNYSALAGTVAVTNGSADVTGTGTSFTSLTVGQTIAVKLASGIVITGTITTITDDTHIVLSAVWPGDPGTGLPAYGETGTLSSPTLKPVTTVPANWPCIGTIMEPEFDAGAEFDDVKAPSPAALEITGKLYKGSKPVWKLKLNEVSELTFESALIASGAITDGTSVTLQGGTGLLEGWWQFTNKSQAGNETILIEQYGVGMVKGFKMPGGHVMPEVEISVFTNPLANAKTGLAAG